ncbi:MAG TPA: tetratricopeptide repeat protein [Tepidisphaeraceae bacterium]|nr:tetratricopeptide repeat protein [Tepidisphaeraceae bacterium]
MSQITIPQAIELAVNHHQAGRLHEAEIIYRQILAQEPTHPDALHLLGVLAMQVGQHEPAMGLIRQAIAINGSVADYHCNLGYALAAVGQTRAAIESYRRALAIRPNFAQASNNLGNALRGAGELDESIAVLRQSLKVQSDNPEALNSLGCSLRASGRTDESIAAFEKALSLRPQYAEAHNNLGNALREKDQPEPAIEHFRQALAIRPEFSEVLNNLAGALEEQGKFEPAIETYRQAARVNPELVTAHVNLGIALLRQGNFGEGWREYAWRWHKPGREQPIWDGQPLDGKRLLIYAEQGLGDSIQFIRYMPLAAERGARIILQIPKELNRLLKDIPNVANVILDTETVPEVDFHCPLLNLPLVMGTSMDTIPANVPYVKAEDELSSRWRERLQPFKNSFKVGLTWQGRKEYTNDRRRSLSPGVLEPLFKLAGLTFFSLQKGAQRQPQGLVQQLSMIDWSDEFHDLADTAALVNHLDLVISVDTAMAHLAGAMGKRVWTLLPFVPDWRWLLDRSDSPWYPTMRLFRQPRVGDWPAVIERVISELKCLI